MMTEEEKMIEEEVMIEWEEILQMTMKKSIILKREKKNSRYENNAIAR